MAIRSDNKSSNKPVKTTATGNAADTGTPASTMEVPPTKPPRIRFNDDFGGRGTLNYGRNRSMTPASIEPGTTLVSDLADDLRTTVGDPVLDALQKHGSAAMRAPEVGDDVEDVRGIPATQIRKIGAKNVPDSHGMESARSRQPSYPGPKTNVPAANSYGGGQPVRKP